MLSNEKWFGASAPFYLETIDQSLRFNDDDTANLSKTPSSAGNRKTFTWSAWVKRGNISSTQTMFASAVDGNNASWIRFTSGNAIEYVNVDSASTTDSLITSRLFRDTTNWYHIVLVVDTTEATDSDRIKIYINGIQETSFSTSNYPTLNYDTDFSNTCNHQLGARNSTVQPFDGYMAEVNFIDGTAIGSTSRTNASTGVTEYVVNEFGEFKNDIWIPKAYSGSYGTNGFRFTFADSSNLGDDTSGNGNDFTSSGLASHDVVTDSPTNNFATLNIIGNDSGITFRQGNLQPSLNANTSTIVEGTFAVSSGKWYWEVRVYTYSSAPTCMIGIKDLSIAGHENDNWNTASVYAYYGSNGNKYNSGSSSSYGATFTTGDIIGVALDLDAGTLTFYKNGSSQGTAFSSLTGEYTLHLGTGLYYWVANVNFGQEGSFAGNETAQGNADDNGIGDFYYSPPSGHLALCSSNLPDTTLSPNKGVGFQADDHFNTITYTGDDASSRSLTGVGFQPDWIWYKHRSIGYGHVMYDSSRGTGENYLRVDGTIAEGAYNDLYGTLTSFDADGITIARGDASGTESAFFNTNGATVVGWNWKCGGTAPTKTYKVVVVSDSGNKYRFRNSADSATFAQSAVTLDLQEGGTYTFDLSDSTMSGHPLRFSTTSDGTHGGGSEYTTGVTTNGTAGSAGATITITVASSAPTLYYYCSNHSGMGGQINTNTTFGQTNFDGSVLSVLQSNTTAGFSIVKYIGSSGAQNVGHGLTQAPELLFVKDRDATSNWWTGTTVIDGSMDFLYLNSTSAGGNSSISVPTSTTFNVDGTDLNTTGNNKVAYCFHSVEGFSKFGSFTGNGSADGTFVYTGFRPAFVIIKGSSLVSEWYIWDSVRNPHNVVNATLNLTPSQSEYSGGAILLDFYSNGFKVRDTVGSWNYNGGTYIYIAFAEQPFHLSNAR